MTFRKKIATSGAVLALGCSLLSSSVLAPAAYAAPEPSATPIVKEYTDGATLTFPSTWTEGEPLEFSGVNFFATDGTPLSTCRASQRWARGFIRLLAVRS